MLANLAQQFNVPVANAVVGIASLAVLIITLIAATIYALLSASDQLPALRRCHDFYRREPHRSRRNLRFFRDCRRRP